MSQPEPSSQDSTDTQEIYSQGSFEEIWQCLGRTFSNPDKLFEGVLEEKVPLSVEIKDQPEDDNLEVTYEQRIIKTLGQPSSPPSSQQFSDFLQPSSQLDPQILNVGNGHAAAAMMINGTSPANNMSHVYQPRYHPITLPPILPNNSYPGHFKFNIDFERNTDPITKATPWVYIPERQKLFVKMQCVCPILFKIKGTPPPGSGIRGILLYKRPEHYKEIVMRCPNHKNTCKDDHLYQDHVMRCENPSTVYETCPKTDRLSLFIPLSAMNPEAGEGNIKELFRFTCFNSCVGGMNRRPTYLLFRLECGGTFYGRAIVEIRICASPGRDSTEKELGTNQKNVKNTDKRSSNEPTSTTDIITSLPTTSTPSFSPTTAYPHRASVLMSPGPTAPEPYRQFPNVETNQPKKRQYHYNTESLIYKKAKKCCSPDSTDDELFTITIRGRERYEMLKKITAGLHLLDGLQPPPDQNRNRYDNNGVESSQEFTKIQPKSQPFEIKKERPDSSQCNGVDVSPPSSQENSQVSQLSRTSSNASSQCSTTHSEQLYSVSKLTMKRTMTLKKSPEPYE